MKIEQHLRRRGAGRSGGTGRSRTSQASLPGRTDQQTPGVPNAVRTARWVRQQFLGTPIRRQRYRDQEGVGGNLLSPRTFALTGTGRRWRGVAQLALVVLITPRRLGTSAWCLARGAGTSSVTALSGSTSPVPRPDPVPRRAARYQP